MNGKDNGTDKAGDVTIIKAVLIVMLTVFVVIMVFIAGIEVLSHRGTSGVAFYWRAFWGWALVVISLSAIPAGIVYFYMPIAIITIAIKEPKKDENRGKDDKKQYIEIINHEGDSQITCYIDGKEKRITTTPCQFKEYYFNRHDRKIIVKKQEKLYVHDITFYDSRVSNVLIFVDK